MSNSPGVVTINRKKGNAGAYSSIRLTPFTISVVIAAWIASILATAYLVRQTNPELSAAQSQVVEVPLPTAATGKAPLEPSISTAEEVGSAATEPGDGLVPNAVEQTPPAPAVPQKIVFPDAITLEPAFYQFQSSFRRKEEAFEGKIFYQLNRMLFFSEDSSRFNIVYATDFPTDLPQNFLLFSFEFGIRAKQRVVAPKEVVFEIDGQKLTTPAKKELGILYATMDLADFEKLTNAQKLSIHIGGEQFRIHKSIRAMIRAFAAHLPSGITPGNRYEVVHKAGLQISGTMNEIYGPDN